MVTDVALLNCPQKRFFERSSKYARRLQDWLHNILGEFQFTHKDKILSVSPIADEFGNPRYFLITVDTPQKEEA